MASEELIHALAPVLKGLARSFEHGSLPDDTTRTLFADTVVVADLGPAARTRRVERRRVWRAMAEPVAAGPVARGDLSLWASARGSLGSVGEAELRVAAGRFPSSDRSRFTADLIFEARGVKDGQVTALRGGVRTVWQAAEVEGGGIEWKIEEWSSRPAEIIRAAAPFFVEALDSAVQDRELRRELRRSRHEELALEKIRSPQSFRNPHRHFFLGSQDRHPAISVADVNRDGFDDLYVMARWGANRLLLGGASGFEDASAAAGLDIRDHSAAAIFADFDNDGDVDLFLGRTMVPSVFMRNENGRFTDRSDLFPPGALPALVSSVNAVDANGDGLLDIYVSTYAAQMLVFDLKIYQAKNPGRVAPEGILSDFLPSRHAARLSRKVRTKGAHIYRNLPGPPNVLFINEGSRFRLLEQGPLVSYRNTYQATWADYDRDGDADVYLANDFAPNQLLRNDGDESFSDVTRVTETADIGFGMGATWGDYDRDGWQDLYVSNMYSKAGRRITAHFDEISADFEKMARGNTLFRNRAGRFEHVSGLAPPTMEVEAAGWSWGGQFADFDNDGHLDLYVASGYYTAPEEVAVAVDT